MKHISLYYIIIFIFLLNNTIFAQVSNGEYTQATQCLGTELDGSVTLKSWGNGRNNSDAVEQAKKQAVNDVLFLGIKSGASSCISSPIVIDKDVKSRNEDYFATFFSDNGPYLEYVSLKDEKISYKLHREKKKSNTSVTKSVIVRVNRLGLKKKLVADNIIKNYRE